MRALSFSSHERAASLIYFAGALRWNLLRWPWSPRETLATLCCRPRLEHGGGGAWRRRPSGAGAHRCALLHWCARREVSRDIHFATHTHKQKRPHANAQRFRFGPTQQGASPALGCGWCDRPRARRAIWRGMGPALRLGSMPPLSARPPPRPLARPKQRQAGGTVVHVDLLCLGARASRVPSDNAKTKSHPPRVPGLLELDAPPCAYKL